MVALGDHLSDEIKGKIIAKIITIGEVYRMNLTKKEKVKGKKPVDKSRNKYFIVIGLQDGMAVGMVLINTNINPFLDQEMKDLHYPLKVEDYPFLETDRFACCGELKAITMDRFSEMFGEPKGNIEDYDLELIKDAVISSPKVTPKELKRFGLK